MTRDGWECSSGLWPAQNRRSTLIGKAILDPHCPIRRHPTGSHGPARNPSNGNSGRGSLSCYDRSNGLQFKALALSPRRSPDMRPSICLYNDATDKRGIGTLRLWRLRLADSLTLLHQRSDNRSSRILSSNTPRIPHTHFDPRTNRNCVRSIVRWRVVLFVAEPSQDTILVVR